MTRIRAGCLEYDGFDASGDCAFCAKSVSAGAYWMGATDLFVCSACVARGALGKLLGDCARDAADLQRALDATAREAWRALVLAKERAAR